MIRQFVMAVLLVLNVAHAQVGNVSTPADRAKAVEIARSLETDPLGKQAPEQRIWFSHFIANSMDLPSKACGEVIQPVFESQKNYSREIFIQLRFSVTAFVILHPDKANDDMAMYLAALEGSLRVYEAILKVHPDARWPVLDDLIEKRNKGELTGYVRLVCRP